VIGSTKCPSPTSKWKMRTPGAQEDVDLVAEVREVGGVQRGLDLDGADPVVPTHGATLRREPGDEEPGRP
jgi:hypothetical protein